ncbi:MAG TPA: glucose-6-phosphate dehydrogenase, partial [Armatimonadota bacterium]|nr:glucose-6-phosphate dehydrogenase [Armatimonadota bacterium]
ASGDLTRRKLIPALWNLYMERRLPEAFSIIGLARSEKSDESFRQEAREAVARYSRFREPDPEEWDRFAAGLFYLRGQYDSPQTFQQLRGLLDHLCDQRGSCGNTLFYLATPPSGYEEIVEQLGAAGFSAQTGKGQWSRIIVEKPFGRDLASARSLNAKLKRVFNEDQIYRIDHYLGKETVQNLLVLRFANGIFEPIWNRRYVDHVQVSAAEDLGVEGRGAYYEEAGALRDMVQNHLMQVMCLTAMEPPTRFDHRQVRNEKMKVLEAVRPISIDEVPEWTVLGQYGPGVIHGRPVPGYKQEPGVSPTSRTETYAAVKFLVDNWRWAGVPFYLRTGKRLPERLTEVSIHFKRAPHLLFRDFGDEAPERNVLTIRIQPDEGICLRFGVKVPGTGMVIRPVTMRFSYAEEFHQEPPEAYERLLLDCMLGDITLFSRDDWMEASWALIDPILQWWHGGDFDLPQYPAGTWGPGEADDLLAKCGHAWQNPDPAEV